MAAAFSLAAAIADDPADPDPDVDAPTAVLRPTLRLNERVFDQQLFYGMTAAEARDRLGTLLKEKIDVIDWVCRLTDGQKQKLQRAGQRDIKQFFDRADEITRKFQSADNITKLNEFKKEAQPFNRSVRTGLTEDTLFEKVLEKVLTADQAVKHKPVHAIIRRGWLLRIRRSGTAEMLDINLPGTASADDELVRLNDLPESPILALNLIRTTVTDAGLDRLKGKTNLKDLYLDSTQVSDGGLLHLTRLTNLELLGLGETRVTDAGLDQLKGLTGLRWLRLSKTQVTDAGLARLKGLTNLQQLDLEDMRVTDAGLAHLTGLTNLQVLNICGTQVTDAGLLHLKGLNKLEQLWLRDTPITDAAIAELQRALPGLKIER
jgi:hypothetical protein